MYIRQECLFSFEEILKFQKENKLQLILSQLDFSNLIIKETGLYPLGPLLCLGFVSLFIKLLKSS